MQHSEDGELEIAYPNGIARHKLETSMLQSKPTKFAVLATQAMSLIHGDDSGLSKSCNDPDLSLGRTATWRMSVQMALAGTAAAVALMVGSAVCRADSLEPSLIGAWASSAPDCAKLFVGQRGGLAYRQPVDKFAQALIIGPQQIRSPSSTCRVQSVSHEKGAIKVNAECEDSISFQQQSAWIRMQPSGEMLYSTTGDPALNTTLIRCRL